MALNVVITVGEYLGRLPFRDDENAEFFADAFMSAGHLVALDPDQAEILAFCRGARSLDEVQGFLAENGIRTRVFTELVTKGLLLSGPIDTAFSWLGDCVLFPSGRSLGLADDGLLLLTPQDEVLQVSAVYYWVWTYARTGQRLRAVVEFLRRHATISDVLAASEEELSQAIVHMLSYNMGRLDLAPVSA